MRALLSHGQRHAISLTLNQARDVASGTFQLDAPATGTIPMYAGPVSGPIQLAGSLVLQGTLTGQYVLNGEPQSVAGPTLFDWDTTVDASATTMVGHFTSIAEAGFSFPTRVAGLLQPGPDEGSAMMRAALIVVLGFFAIWCSSPSAPSLAALMTITLGTQLLMIGATETFSAFAVSADGNGGSVAATWTPSNLLLIRLFQQTTICCDQASSRSLTISRPPWMRR